MGTETIAERLQGLIDEKGVTPYVISKKTGVSQATISRILTRITKKLNINSAAKLSAYFHVDCDWLVTGKGERAPSTAFYERPVLSAGKASDVAALYGTGDRTIAPGAYNPLVKAVETMAESNMILAENNRRVTKTNEKVMTKMLEMVDDKK